MSTERCEICEQPTSEPIVDPEEGVSFCGCCAVELIGAERDVYKRALKAIAHNDGGWCGDKAREALHLSREDRQP